MHPDLVCPAGSDVNSEKSCILKLPFNFPVSMSFLPICRIHFHPNRTAPRHLADGKVNLPSLFRKIPFRHCQIFLLIPPPLPFLRKPGRRQFRLGKKHGPGGVLIQPPDGTQNRHFSLFLKISHKQIGQRVLIMPTGRMHKNPLRLVHHNEIFILIKNRDCPFCRN